MLKCQGLDGGVERKNVFSLYTSNKFVFILYLYHCALYFRACSYGFIRSHFGASHFGSSHSLARVKALLTCWARESPSVHVTALGQCVTTLGKIVWNPKFQIVFSSTGLVKHFRKVVAGPGYSLGLARFYPAKLRVRI